MYNIQNFGAVADGKTNATSAVQKAVDACHKDGGGVVYIPFGVYVLASVHLYSNIHFVFEPGAKLLGSFNMDDFDEREKLDYPLYQDVSHSYFRRAMFWGENCENISFSGNGTIDMREVWENDPVEGADEWINRRAAKIFALKNCKSVSIKDLQMYNATDLAIYMAGCEDVIISSITMKVNIDGISPDCCKNIIISDCNIIAGDDGIVLKSSYALNEKRHCENIVISNCIVSSRMCAIKIGTETNGDFRNIAINNCSIYDTCLTGLALEIADGGNMDGVSVSNIVMNNVGTPFIVMLTDRRNGPKGTKLGSIKNVVIDNLVANGPYGFIEPIRYTTAIADEALFNKPTVITSSVIGQPQSHIENISLSNIYITVPGGGKAEDREIVVPEKDKVTPAASAFGSVLPAYGIYFRHAKGVRCNNVHVFAIEDDARDALKFDNCEMDAIKQQEETK